MKKNISTHKLKIRNLKPSDYNDIKDIMEEAYAQMGGPWEEIEFLYQNSSLKIMLPA